MKQGSQYNHTGLAGKEEENCKPICDYKFFCQFYWYLKLVKGRKFCQIPSYSQNVITVIIPVKQTPIIWSQQTLYWLQAVRASCVHLATWWEASTKDHLLVTILYITQGCFISTFQNNFVNDSCIVMKSSRWKSGAAFRFQYKLQNGMQKQAILGIPCCQTRCASIISCSMQPSEKNSSNNLYLYWGYFGHHKFMSVITNWFRSSIRPHYLLTEEETELRKATYYYS